jgi:hypothetical protein
MWAVGSFSTVAGTVANTYTLTEHFNGLNWTVVPSLNPAPRSRLNGARQVLKAVTAVDRERLGGRKPIDTASGSFLPDKTLILHWSGTAGRRRQP